jgi:hypothetical protein
MGWSSAYEAPESSNQQRAALKAWTKSFQVSDVTFDQQQESGGSQNSYSLLASAAAGEPTRVDREVRLFDPIVYVKGRVANTSDVEGTVVLELKVALCPGFEGGGVGAALGRLISRGEGTTSGGATSVSRRVKVRVPAGTTRRFTHTVDLRDSAVCSPDVEWVKGSVRSVER